MQYNQNVIHVIRENLLHLNNERAKNAIVINTLQMILKSVNLAQPYINQQKTKTNANSTVEPSLSFFSFSVYPLQRSQEWPVVPLLFCGFYHSVFQLHFSLSSGIASKKSTQ